jgi:hypothetical protein
LRLAAAVAERPETAPLLALAGGLPASFLLNAFLIYLFAPAARIINGAGSVAAIGARPLALLTAASGSAAVLGLAGGLGASAQANEFLLLVGILGSAKWAAWAGLIAGILGVALLFSTIRERGRSKMPIGVFSGLVITSLSAIGLAAFLARWDLLPF